MIYTNLEKAKIVYGYETSKDTLDKFIESVKCGKTQIYRWRRDWDLKKKRGHPANIKKAEQLVEKYTDQVAEDAAEQAPPANKPAAKRAPRGVYPDEIKQAALAEYRALLSKGEKYGANKLIQKKYKLGTGVIGYWHRQDQSKPRNEKEADTKQQPSTAHSSAAPAIDIKGAIIFLKQAADYFRHKDPVELNDQELMILHALRALTGKGRV